MFGSSKKKKKKQNAAIKFAEGILQIQLEEYSGNAKEDPFLLGYVYGVSDCAIQRVGIEDDIEAIGSMTVVCVRLFGTDEGSKSVGRMLACAKRMDDFPEFVSGLTMGGNEANDIFNAWATNTEPPVGLGLVKHLRNDGS